MGSYFVNCRDQLGLSELGPAHSSSLERSCCGKKRKKIWLAAPLCLFWNLWRARNSLVFENEVPSAQRLKANIVTNLWYWANLNSEDYSHSVVDFLTWMGTR